jgi:IS605 OrfB family transposase
MNFFKKSQRESINNYVRAVKTISIKIFPPKEEYIALMKQSQLLFDDYVNWMYDNGTYNKNLVHKALYKKFIEKYPFVKVALQQSIRDVASECCKRSKLKGKKPSSKSLTLRLNKASYAIRGKLLSIIGTKKRHKELLTIPDYYRDTFENWNAKGASLCYVKKTKQFWLRIMFESPQEIQQQSVTSESEVVGIDRGCYNPVVTSDSLILSKSNHIRNVKSKYAYLRQKLQRKGTRSAKRVLRRLSGKEKRFTLDTNHCLSKRLVNSDYKVFVLEKLKKMRSKKYGKKLNKMLSNWSYYQFEILLKYKALNCGKQVVYVHPAYTSQTCSKCGIVNVENRIGNKYSCSCGNNIHADINAAKNIKQKFLQQHLYVVEAATNQPHESSLMV